MKSTASRLGFNLYLITDRNGTAGRPLLHVVEAALKGGVRGVQLREKDLPAAELFELACALRLLTSRYGAKLLVNDRIDIALAAGADGVHLAGHSLPTEQARRLLGPDRLIGVSCHDLASVQAAAALAADFVTFGPVYYTPSKARYGTPVGTDSLKIACAAASLPVFALGGISRANIAETAACGAYGAALISAVLSADDPARESAFLLSLLPPPGLSDN